MAPISYRRHRFPPVVIQHAVWLYLRYRWHPDEMVVRIAGQRMYLWRAVDHEGEVLDMLVQLAR